MYSKLAKKYKVFWNKKSQFFQKELWPSQETGLQKKSEETKMCDISINKTNHYVGEAFQYFRF